jgi:hypothetical protein
MWLSQGNINLNHPICYDIVWNLSKTRLDNGFKDYHVFLTLLFQPVKHAVSMIHTNKHTEINPGKNRFLASWFKNVSHIPAVVYHTPKVIDWLDNQDYVPPNIEDYNITIHSFDHEQKIMFVRKDWFDTNRKFKLDSGDIWKEKMDPWGTIQWFMHGQKVYEHKTNQDLITKIDLKHPMGIWESICFLSGLPNYRKLDYFTKLY